MTLITIFIKFAVSLKNGLLAEWLGGGLQNRIRRFESARDLNVPLNALFVNNLQGIFSLPVLYWRKHRLPDLQKKRFGIYKQEVL